MSQILSDRLANFGCLRVSVRVPKESAKYQTASDNDTNFGANGRCGERTLEMWNQNCANEQSGLLENLSFFLETTVRLQV